jgi:hypothetical protein
MTLKPIKCIVLQAKNDNDDYIATGVPDITLHIEQIRAFALDAARYFYPDECLSSVSVVINDTDASHRVTFYHQGIGQYVSFDITWYRPWIPRNMLAELEAIQCTA